MGINEVIEKYQVGKVKKVDPVVYSCRISPYSRLKLNFVSEILDVKKTVLAGQLLNAAIDEAFDRLRDEIDSENMDRFTYESALIDVNSGILTPEEYEQAVDIIREYESKDF